MLLQRCYNTQSAMTFKENLLHLAFMAFVLFKIGLFHTVIGISLPDLQCVFSTDLSEVSSLFLAAGISMMTACIPSAYMLRKWNVYLLVAVAAVIYSCSISLVAVTGYIQVAITALVVAGFSIIIEFTSSIYLCNVIFPETAYAFHVLTTALSTGNLLCPIIAKPFLRGNQQTGDSNISVYNATLGQTVYGGLSTRDPYVNDSNNRSMDCDNFESHVHYLYILLGAISFPAALCFGACFIKTKDLRQTKVDEYIEMGGKGNKFVILFTALLVVAIPLPYGLSYSYGSYLTTLGITGTLHLGVQKMANLASAFWLVFLIGRLTSTVLSVYIRQVVILYVCLICEIACVALIILTGGKHEVYLWIGSLSLAFFNAPIFGTLVVWSKQYVTWTPVVVALCSMADSAGSAFLPFISGQVISSYGEEGHLYYCLGQALFEIVVIFVLHCVGRFFFEVKDHTTKDDRDEERITLQQTERQ